MAVIVEHSSVLTVYDMTDRAVGRPLPTWVTLLLAAVVVPATVAGLLADGVYQADAYQVAIWRGQDAVTLAILPLLVWSAVRARAGSLRAHLLWVGLALWIAYCYAHLAVGVPYNSILLLYVAAFGISAYGVVDGLLRVDVGVAAAAFPEAPRQAAAWFLVLGGVGMAGLWLSEIVAALPDGQPPNLVNGMPHATYLLDLAVLIPLAVAAAWMLRRRRPAGVVLGGVVLVMLTVLSLAMLALLPFAVTAGLTEQAEYEGIFAVFTVIFGVMLVVEVGLLAAAVRHAPPVRDPWLGPSLWRDDRGSAG